MTKRNFEEVQHALATIIKRRRKLKATPKQKELAALLGIDAGAFAVKKKRESIPLAEIVHFCAVEGINPTDVLYEREVRPGAAA